MPSLTIDAKALVTITPVSVDDEDNVITKGMPIQVTLQELADWIVTNGDDGSGG